MFNLLIGGAAGQGIDKTAGILEKLIKRAGFSVFTIRDVMSRIRGGHNFSVIGFGPGPVLSHSEWYDGIVALNGETIENHRDHLRPEGFIICDGSLKGLDHRILDIDIGGIAKELGNPQVAGSAAIGIILKLFGLEPGEAAGVFEEFIAGQLIDINLKAVAAGYGAAVKRYDAAAGDTGDSIVISGSGALALGALAAGIRFYSAYPMSPSTSIMEFLAAHGDETNVVVEQAEDEIAAINMALGASFAGARAMTGTSGGGFSLMVEALGLSGMAEIPVVIVDAQRPGPATGFPTRTEQGDLKFVISAAQGEFPRMVIAPRNHSDAFYQTVRAFKMAEKYQIPVIILADQYLCDSTSTVQPFYIEPQYAVPAEEGEGEYLRYRWTEDGISPRLFPGQTRHLVTADSDEHGEDGRITESADVRIRMVNKRMKKLELLSQELEEPAFIGSDGFETLLLGWGSTHGPISDAVARLNDGEPGKYAALVFGDVWPLPKKRLLEKAAAARKILHVEQNATGQLAALIREQTGIVCSSGILKYDGRQISGEEIAARVRAEAVR